MSPLLDRLVIMVNSAGRRLLEIITDAIPVLATAAVVLLATWGIAKLAYLAADFSVRYVASPMRRDLIRQVSYYSVWVVGVVMALKVIGLDAGTLVTGLGLGGVALGFALKDILSNLTSGLLIQVTHSFNIDDQIVVGEAEGTVERIEFRATHIRTYDGRLVLVPNGEVFTSRLTNNTESPILRASVFVFIDYQQDLDLALSTVLRTVVTVRGVSEVPAATVRLHELTPTHMQIEARFWTDSKRAEVVQTSSNVRIALVDALLKAGIVLPHPADRIVTLADRPVGVGGKAPGE